MYEQTYSHEVVAAYEQQRRERAIERRRSLREHADQIVPRPAGVWRRMLARMLGRRPSARDAMHARPVAAR